MRKGDGGKKKGRKGEEITKTEFWKCFIKCCSQQLCPTSFLNDASLDVCKAFFIIRDVITVPCLSKWLPGKSVQCCRPLWKIHVHSAGLMPPQFKSSFKTGKTIHPVSEFRSTGALLKPPHLQVSSLKTKQAILEHLPDLRAVTFHVYMVPQVDDSHFTL